MLAFVAAFVRVAQTRSFAAGLTVAVLAWLTLALATIALPISLVSALTAIAVGSGVVVLLGTSRVGSLPTTAIRAGWHLLLARGLIAGLVVASVALGAGRLGPTLAGLAYAFPTTMLASLWMLRAPLRARVHARDDGARAGRDRDLCRLLPDAPLRRRAAAGARRLGAGGRRRDPDRAAARAGSASRCAGRTQLPPAEQASPPGRPGPVTRHPTDDPRRPTIPGRALTRSRPGPTSSFEPTARTARLPDYLQRLIVPVHRAGWPFIAGGLLVTILLAWLAGPLLWLGLLPTAWMTYFFRDPPRVTPQGEDLVVSPADGTVQAIALRRPPPELELGEAPRTCISVFLNIFDVHVNRAPIGGRITRLAYHPGRFLNAAHDKASDLNERQSFRIETAQGEVFGLVQIAGLIARRIVRFVEPGAAVEAGQRVGLIRFGSRCDVYLPDGFAPMVAPGQRAIAGETVLADGRRNYPPSAWRQS